MARFVWSFLSTSLAWPLGMSLALGACGPLPEPDALESSSCVAASSSPSSATCEPATQSDLAAEPPAPDPHAPSRDELVALPDDRADDEPRGVDPARSAPDGAAETEPAEDDDAAEDPAAEDPAAEDPAAEDPAGDDVADGEPTSQGSDDPTSTNNSQPSTDESASPEDGEDNASPVPQASPGEDEANPQPPTSEADSTENQPAALPDGELVPAPGFSDDLYEPNDSSSEVVDLSDAQYADLWTHDGHQHELSVPDLVLVGPDLDYFRIALTTPSRVAICIELEDPIRMRNVGASTNLKETILQGSQCIFSNETVAAGPYTMWFDHAESEGALSASSYALNVLITETWVFEDNDDDGVIGADDNCPDRKNPDQRDYNDDGVGDACDDELDACVNWNTCDPALADCHEDRICYGRITLDEGKRIRYWRNLPLGTPNEAVQRALVVVHGTGRTAHSYFANAVQAALAVGAERNTIIITPQFITNEEAPAADELRWTSQSWKEGRQAKDFPHTSSFRAMDIIIKKLARNSHFPNLEDIVVFGHSAGGQYVQRYAASGRAEHEVGEDIAYLVANPSSYMFLNNQRPVDGSDLDTFAVPFTFDPFNVYKYGLDFLPPYLAAAGLLDIAYQLTHRDVTLLIGSEEQNCFCSSGVALCPEDADCSCNNNNHPDLTKRWLDCSDPATWQGTNRYDRAVAYDNHLDTFFAGHNTRRIIVPGVGHSSGGIIRSDEAAPLLFP